MPTDYWLANDLREMTDDLMSGRGCSGGLFRPEAVRKLIAEHRSGRRLVCADLAILTLELWCKFCGSVRPLRRTSIGRGGWWFDRRMDESRVATGGDCMKQVLQSARTGAIEVAEVPAPRVLPGCVLVRIAASVVSAGTERASTDFAAKSLLQKARSRPDLVREVMNKVRRDGLLSAASAVRNRLDQPAALGYSSAGTVVEVGEGITDLRAGDRVACAGAGFAVHAEFACVPRLLVARIPSAEVEFESAAFTTIGAVAIHGVRTADAKLGDVVSVVGLGLIGQLAVQILNAEGAG